jgi:hypothetical protein
VNNNRIKKVGRFIILGVFCVGAKSKELYNTEGSYWHDDNPVDFSQRGPGEEIRISVSGDFVTGQYQYF